MMVQNAFAQIYMKGQILLAIVNTALFRVVFPVLFQLSFVINVIVQRRKLKMDYVNAHKD